MMTPQLSNSQPWRKIEDDVHILCMKRPLSALEKNDIYTYTAGRPPVNGCELNLWRNVIRHSGHSLRGRRS